MKPENRKRAKRKNRGPTEAFKLTDTLPDWITDEACHDKEDGGCNEILFPEEALLGHNDKDGGNTFEPFIPDFCSSIDNAGWMLGSAHHPQVKDDGKLSGFDQCLTTLLKQVRNYNASLYWLRLHHLHVDGNDVSDLDPIPSEGDVLNPKCIGEDTVKAAEERWTSAVSALRHTIQEKYDGTHEIRVDAVRVNNYIISVRVIGGVHDGFGEVGGSESSHNFIDSPFSSTSP